MTEASHVLTAKYRVVTPMFLSGADQNAAELRLPSFKGALRFWWRALSAERDARNLREAEDRLFGSTRTGASRVRMAFVHIDVHLGSQNKFARNSWQSYIGYGLIDKPGQTRRGFIEPGSAFSVRLDASRCNEKEFQQLEDALIALGLVGGLGSRARNGWGSITLTSLESDNTVWKAPASVDNLKDELAKRVSGNSPIADWSVFSDQSLFAVGQPQDTHEQAQKWLSEKYREAIKALSEDKSHREAFGLPRRNSGKNASIRRAGATFLHIHEAEGGQAIPLALCLPARFLEGQDGPQGGWKTAKKFLKGVAVR